MPCSTTNHKYKTIAHESSQGRSLTTSVFVFLFGNGKEIGNARSEKQNRIYSSAETCRYQLGTENKNQEHIIITSNTQLKIINANDSSMKIQMQMIYESHSQPFLLPLKSQCMSFYSIV